MFILWWFLFGGLIGWLASIIAGNSAIFRPSVYVSIGMVGALTGSAISGLFGLGGPTGYHIGNLVIALATAVLSVSLLRVAGSRRAY